MNTTSIFNFLWNQPCPKNAICDPFGLIFLLSFIVLIISFYFENKNKKKIKKIEGGN